MGGDIHFEWGIRALTLFQLCNHSLFLGRCNPVEIISAEAVARQSYHADFPLRFTAAPLALSPPHFPWPRLCLPDAPSWSSGSSWITSGSSGFACLIFWGCLLVVSSTFDAVHLRFFDLGGIFVAGVGVVKGWGNKQQAGHSKSRVNKLMIKPIFFYSKITAVWCSWLEHMCYDDVWGSNLS